MAHHASAKKRIRQTTKKTAVNRARMSKIRTFIRKVEEEIAGGDRQAATEALRRAQPEIARGICRRLLHRNTGARKLSRLSARIKAMPSQ